MKTINILDKQFEHFIDENTIQNAVKDVASKINHDYDGKNPLFLCVLNGAFMFTADLLKSITIPCEVAFIRFASYDGTESTGKVVELVGLACEIKDRNVIILEDIVDSGLTMKTLLKLLEMQQPKDVKIATMFFKPERLEFKSLLLDYIGMEIPNDFIVGYGLDYNEQGRNLNEVYKIKETAD